MPGENSEDAFFEECFSLSLAKAQLDSLLIGSVELGSKEKDCSEIRLYPCRTAPQDCPTLPKQLIVLQAHAMLTVQVLRVFAGRPFKLYIASARDCRARQKLPQLLLYLKAFDSLRVLAPRL